VHATHCETMKLMNTQVRVDTRKELTIKCVGEVLRMGLLCGLEVLFWRPQEAEEVAEDLYSCKPYLCIILFV
jgi:hypothetical protein